MNAIVCSVTLIYLCLGNVAGLTGDKVIQFIDSSEKNQNFKCISKNKRVHQWYHVYPNGSQQQPIYIGNIPRQCEVKTTEYIITLETFDINTGIYCDNGSNEKEKTGVWIFRRFVGVLKKIKSLWDSEPSYKSLIQKKGGTNETYTDNEEPAFLKYNEKQKVAFKCQKYMDKTNLVIGVINTTSNTIQTFNKTFPDRIFNLSQNGTVLCCIYYEVNTEGSESCITRHVADKTLLVYDETVTVPVTVPQDSSEEKDNSTGEDDESPDDDKGNQDADSGNQGSDSSNQEADSNKQEADSGKQSSGKISNSGKKDANSNKHEADSGKQSVDSSKQEADSGKQVADSSKQDDNSDNPPTTIYIITAVAVVFILLVTSVIYLKRCRKKPKVEVETKVLYADLDFLRRNEPESLPREGPQEESPYAQIIGEIRP